MTETNSNINSNFLLNNVKCKYIIEKIFENVEMNKFLNIIRYNKILQKRLDKNINDYKNQIKIEIEIFPKENHYGKFININCCREYYHIYFNDNEKEEKNNHITMLDNARKIKVIIDFEVKSFNGLFQDCQCVKKINFIKFNRSDITDMGYMFSRCWSLEEINFNHFKSNKVNNMKYMFSECSSMKELNLSNFNTEKVINMEHMFFRCDSLKILDISKFNTYNVKNMSFMFNVCSSLENLVLSNFKTNNVTDMSYMFFFIFIIKRIKSF